MHPFSSNAIFHAYDDNLKMQQNLSAEKIQIGVTELPDQVRQTHFQSVTTKFVYFPKHVLQSSAATRENDRTLAVTELSSQTSTKICILCFKLARFIFFVSATQEQNANNETLRTTV